MLGAPVGVVSVIADIVTLVMFADVRDPTILVAILFQAFSVSSGFWWWASPCTVVVLRPTEDGHISQSNGWNRIWYGL